MAKSIVQLVLEHAETAPDKTALIDQGRTLTYGELASDSRRFFHGLKEARVRKGSRIILEAADPFLFITGIMGCMLAGCIAVPVEREIPVYKLHRLMQAVKPALCFLEHGGESYRNYLAPEDSGRRIRMPEGTEDAVITGMAGLKGETLYVLHTNASLLGTAQNLASGLSLSEGSVLLTNVPIDLVAGGRRILAALQVGACAVLTRGAVTAGVLDELSRSLPVTTLSLVSPDIAALTEDARLNGRISLGSVTHVESVSGFLSRETAHDFHHQFPGITLYSVYGTSESGCILINNTSENNQPGCIGRPAINADIMLIDEDGHPVTETGAYGYIAVRGTMNMKGYYRKKALTDRMRHEDYLVLNDIAYCDADGYYYYVNHIGEIINIRGYKISPGEIEEAALTFPGIMDCACVGKEEPAYGAVPVLYIVCRDLASLDMDALREHLSGRLEPSRVPQEIIPVRKIPRSGTGKILRRTLQRSL